MQTADPRRWSALAAIALAQFMVIMDTSIIGVALLLLLGGRLADLLGARRIFSLGWAVLAAGSLAAGLAETTGVEIAARVGSRSSWRSWSCRRPSANPSCAWASSAPPIWPPPT